MLMAIYFLIFNARMAESINVLILAGTVNTSWVFNTIVHQSKPEFFTAHNNICAVKMDKII